MKKPGLRIMALVFCITMLVSVFAGCGEQKTSGENTTAGTTAAPTTSAGTSKAAPAEKVTLTLLVDNNTVLDGPKAVFEEIEKKYNVATEIELRPGGAEGDNLVKTRLATGDMADLLMYNTGSLFQALHPDQNFLDITNEAFMANVMDSFRTCVTYNGKQYGVPFGFIGAGGLLYNKKVYSELQLSIPKTWDEFLANCEKVKTAGKTAVIASYKDSWTAQLFVLADYYNVQSELPDFAADYTANKAKYADSPAALSGFQKLEDTFKKGFLNKDAVTTTYDMAVKMLAEGTGVHYPMLTSAVAAIQANFPDKVNDIGFFAQPGKSADKNGLTVWMPAGVYFNKNINKDAAMKWASIFASAEGCNIYMSKQKPDGPFAINGATLPDSVAPAVKDLLPYLESGNNAPALEFLSPIKGPNLEQLCVEAGTGIRPAIECAKDYDKDVEKQAKQLGLAGW